MRKCCISNSNLTLFRTPMDRVLATAGLPQLCQQCADCLALHCRNTAAAGLWHAHPTCTTHCRVEIWLISQREQKDVHRGGSICLLQGMPLWSSSLSTTQGLSAQASSHRQYRLLKTHASTKPTVFEKNPHSDGQRLSTFCSAVHPNTTDTIPSSSAKRAPGVHLFCADCWTVTGDHLKNVFRIHMYASQPTSVDTSDWQWGSLGGGDYHSQNKHTQQ